MEDEARKYLVERYDEAEAVGEVFEVVKDVVKEALNRERAGLMLGIADLGTSSSYWIGAYWMVGSNAIIMNSIPLKRIQDTDPGLFKPYMFHILLHEYLHSIGVLDEERTRQLTYQISLEVFGEDNIITKMAKDISKFIPNISYPGLEWRPDPRDFRIKLVDGFDKSNTRYIG